MSTSTPNLSIPFAKRKTLDIGAYIRSVPDFPKPGIMFRDITTLFLSPTGLRAAVDVMAIY
jgi:adenine phosphoribosyltransferase